MNNKSELQKLYDRYNEIKEQNLNLDMSRGKPSPSQLDLSNNMYKCFTDSDSFHSPSGVDSRNYGLVDGLPELKELFSQIMEAPAENIFISGNSSLNMMYDNISKGFTHGYNGCPPQATQGKIKFLCPSPGYDRHFMICESFGIEMITIDMTATGPDMDTIEKLVSSDSTIKGIWCVPKYSNPDGITYSDETVRRIAALKPAASDFKVYWDNAYAVHDLDVGNGDQLLPIFDEAKKCGNENMIFQFASTSKITFSGAGISAFATGDSELARLKKLIGFQTIGYNKVNQLAHLRLLPDIGAVRAIMVEHAYNISAKFDAVCEALERLLEEGIGSFTRPNGGYFVSYYAESGTAQKIGKLCLDCGLILTKVGAAYPYGIDKKDSHIRIAPTYPSLSELETAMEIFSISAKIAYLEK